MALDDPVVQEDALEPEAEAGGCVARGLVERVALPLEAAVSELVEGVARKQEDRLGRGRSSLQFGAEPDVPDLDHPVLGDDRQVGDDPEGSVVSRSGDGEEDVVVARGLLLERFTEALEVGIGSVVEIGPNPRVSGRRVGGRVQRPGVLGDRPERAVATRVTQEVILVA